MKRLYYFILSLSCLLYLTGGMAYSQAAPPASATGHIFAEIIPMFTATETAQLNFGKFAPGPQGGEIILTPASTVSVLGGVYKGPGTPNAASFYISGDIDAAYTITLPEGAVVLTHISNAKTMKIENWMSNPAPGTGTGKLQDGFQVVYVGATLKVGSLIDNPVGIYTGTYTITFDFN
jgi:Domain of unknown function (DUF4402)